MGRARQMTLGHAQHRGAREYQEDTYAFQLIELPDGSEAPHLLVLADGMGGHVGGRKASELAVKQFLSAFEGAGQSGIAGQLRDALHAANGAIAAAVADEPDLKGMGCTLIAMVAEEDGLHWISVGDSPIWHLSSRGISRVNADHSMAAVFDALISDGRMTHEQAQADPRRSALRSALTGGEIALVDQSVEPLRLHGGEVLILASDGLDTLAPEDIERISRDDTDNPQGLADRLLTAVQDCARPGQDNVTIMVLTARGEGDMSADLGADTLRSSQAPTRQPRPETAAPLPAPRRRIPRWWPAALIALLLLAGLVLVFRQLFVSDAPIAPDLPIETGLPDAGNGEAAGPSPAEELSGSSPTPTGEGIEAAPDATPTGPGPEAGAGMQADEPPAQADSGEDEDE